MAALTIAPQSHEHPAPERVAGDPDVAVSDLWRDHNDELVRHCQRILGNPEEAADAAQDTWLRALTAIRGGNRPDSPRPWLHAVARNASFDALRRRRSMAFAELDEDSLPAGGAVDEDQQTREQLRSLVEDLRTLGDRQRNALVLRELGGLEDDEIADRLGTTPDRAEALVTEARRSLRELGAGRRMPCDAVQREIGRLRVRNRGVRAHIDCCPACRAAERRVRGHRLSSLALLPLPLLRRIGDWLGAGAEQASAGLPKLAVAAAVTISVGGGIGVATSPPSHEAHHTTRAHARMTPPAGALPAQRHAQRDVRSLHQARTSHRAALAHRSRGTHVSTRGESAPNVSAAPAPAQAAPASPPPSDSSRERHATQTSSQHDDSAGAVDTAVQSTTSVAVDAVSETSRTVERAAATVTDAAASTVDQTGSAVSVTAGS